MSLLLSMTPCSEQKPINLSACNRIATCVAISSEVRLKHSPVTELAIGPSNTIEPCFNWLAMAVLLIRRILPL